MYTSFFVTCDRQMADRGSSAVPTANLSVLASDDGLIAETIGPCGPREEVAARWESGVMFSTRHS